MRFLFYSSVFLILYGSLYPFDFSLGALTGEGVERFLYEWSLFSSRGDELGNIALFVPYGFLGIVSLGRRRNLAPAILALTIFGLMLAAWVQILQLIIPSRDAALGDVAWNFAGIAVGILMACPQRVRDAVQHQSVAQSQLIAVLFLGCWLVAELAPFVPSLDLQSFKDSIKPLWQSSSFSVLDLLRGSIAWIVISHIALRSFSPRAAWPLVVLAMCSTLLAKILIVDNAITLADVAAMPVALTGALALGKLGGRQSATLAGLIAGFLIVSGLSPFNFHAAQEFQWIPFAGSLSGSMLLNLKALAAKAFFIGTLMYVAVQGGYTLKRVTTGLAASLLALEIAQIWVGSHTPEITDAILVVLIAVAFHALRVEERRLLPTGPVGTSAEPQSGRPAQSADQRPGLLDRPWLYPGAAGLVSLIIATIALTVAIYAVLGMPKIPYNVRELFGGQDWWRIMFFSLAVFSFGIGGTIAGHRAARSNVPWLALPGYAIFACFITYLLLAASVTSESLADIAGSSNTYFFVMNSGIWGDTGIWLYTLIGSQSLIAAFERIVRFTALMGPVFVWLAIFSAVYFRVTGARFVRPGARIRLMITSLVVYTLSGAIWLVAFRLVAFRYSSTDNLNELVQGNGVFLYLLLILILLNVIAVVYATVSRHLGKIICAALIVAVSLPIGWSLFSSGLSAPVEKYGLTFRGADFLLGPDRREILPQSILMIRWGILQLCTVALLAFGMRILLTGRRSQEPSAFPVPKSKNLS